jgi:hypothetical protein
LELVLKKVVFLIAYFISISVWSQMTRHRVRFNTNDIELKQLCAEQGRCLNILSPQTGRLGKNIARIVDKIKQKTPRLFKLGEVNDIERFKRDLKKQIEFCHAARIRERLLNDRDPEVTKKDREDSEYGAGSWIADGLLNSFYLNWKTYKGKRKFLEDQIRGSVKDVPILKKYLTQSEINEVIKNIARKNVVSSDLLKNKMQLVKEAYKSFTARIIKKVLKDNCLDADGKMVNGIVSDFNSCVNDSVVERNITVCLDKFQQTIGHRVGIQILDSILEKKFAGQKLDKFNSQKAWIAHLKKYAMADYNQCVDRWFFAEDEKIHKRFNLVPIKGSLQP